MEQMEEVVDETREDQGCLLQSKATIQHIWISCAPQREWGVKYEGEIKITI